MAGVYMVVDVHYDGMFTRNPVTYEDDNHEVFDDIDFAGMSYQECYAFMERFTRRRCMKLYYCLPDIEFPDGLRVIERELDYQEFIDISYACGVVLPMYVDHVNPNNILEWLEVAEIVEENHPDVPIRSEIGGDDDEISMEEASPNSLKHEEDPFLKKLCPRKAVGPDTLPEDDIVAEDVHMVEPEHNTETENGVGGDEDAALGDDEDAANWDDEDAADGDDQMGILFNEDVHWKEQYPVLGMRFENAKQLKLMLCNYAVAHGYQLCFLKNDRRRVLVKCSQGKCTFRLWASWMSDQTSFQIKSLKDAHNCARNFRLGSIVTYKWIGTHFTTEFVNKQKMSVRLLREEVKKKFGIEVSMSQCRRAKKYALFLVEGTIVEHYARLWSYGEEIKRSNPGSTFKLDVNTMPDGKKYFSRVYICFEGVKEGWRTGCRRIIHLDGSFLKSFCQGELLCAVGRDANNQIYPIAWAVVSVENKGNWKWFLELVQQDLRLNSSFGREPGSGLVLMSDQHKGLVEAVKEVLPAAEHRQCARHIFANFKKYFNGAQFENLFWKASKTSTEQQFNATMKEIQESNPRAYAYLLQRDPKSWSRAFFSCDISCDAVENGFSESFNSVLRDARKKPIVSMLEDIRLYVMKRMYNMRLKGQKWEIHSICPAIRKELNELCVKQRYWEVVPSGMNQFEARRLSESYAVDVEKRTCSCRMWQLNGYGCVHSVATLAFLNRGLVVPYVSALYMATFYNNSYKHPINGMNGSNMWPETDHTAPLPPIKRRMPGRPKISRRRDASEISGRHTVSKKGMKILCGKCKQPGHNKKTCNTRDRPTKLRSRKTPHGIHTEVHTGEGANQEGVVHTGEGANQEGGVHTGEGANQDGGVHTGEGANQEGGVHTGEGANQAGGVHTAEGAPQDGGVLTGEGSNQGDMSKNVDAGTRGQLKRRKPSERILKKKLARKVDIIEGNSAGVPMEVD